MPHRTVVGRSIRRSEGVEKVTGRARFEGRRTSLWTSSVHPFLIRAETAQMFGVPMPDVRVTAPYHSRSS